MMKLLPVCVLVVVCSIIFARGEMANADQAVLFTKEKPSILVRVQASTWKTRGRLLYDIEGSILKKLSLAGFQTTQDPKMPHHFLLVVQYQEERGAQYGVALWGTTIHVNFVLQGATLIKPIRWEIRETSTNRISGPAPYLDALLKFETHPEYFFLGAMMKGIVKGIREKPDVLMQGVKEFVMDIYPSINQDVTEDGVRVQDHFMDNSNRVYQEVALQRALDELVNQNIPDDRLAPIAKRLIESSDPHSRIRAVQILGRTHNGAFLETLKRLAVEDPNRTVRQTAQQFAPL